MKIRRNVLIFWVFKTILKNGKRVTDLTKKKKDLQLSKVNHRRTIVNEGLIVSLFYGWKQEKQMKK